MRVFFNQEEPAQSLLPLFVITAGYDHIQEPRNRPHGAPYHHIFIVEQGCGVFETEAGTRKIEAGTAVFLPKRFPVNYYGTDETFRTAWVTFDGPGTDGILEYLKAEAMATCPAGALLSQPKEFCRRIRQEESQERLSALLYQLIVSFFERTGKEPDARLKRAKQYATDHCHRDLSVDDMAKAAEISPSLLYRLFREEGKTPVEYLRQVRIQKAKELLLQLPEQKIGEIAAECGFSDFAYFCKVFRESVGETPRTFREKYRT